ncbi:hypothetical protein [Nocardia sp. N2S4-5]|uniref:hypothetical protein n=1 Tax=Nocardia sp. N2S4-5 TaxID=3351565 RepID=UPI0037D854C5
MLKTKPTPGLRGLYYPGATPAGVPLWQSILYFDETFVINPGASLANGRNLQPLHDQVWLEELDAEALDTRLRETFGKSRASRALEFIERLREFDRASLELKRADVLRAIPPQVQKRPDFLELLIADVDDPEFAAVVESGWREPAFIASLKVEFGRGRGHGPAAGSPLVRAGRKLLESLRMREEHGSLWSEPDIFGSTYGVREVEPVIAASILLNHAFLVAEEYGFVPFTDDPMCALLMRRKLERIAAEPGFSDFRRMYAIGASALSLRVLEEHLPSFNFERAEDVLEAREKLRGPLESFRHAMAALTAEVETAPYDPAYPDHIERIVSTKVRPAIVALENEIRTSRDGFVNKVLRNTQTGTLPIVGSIFIGLPASAVIAISAGVLTLEAAAETYLELSRKKRNGFTLFLKR